uniref:Uncharacterized protein n=1 Tax=Manihot esculenta TaxID=3983 RepID=A0A2C9WGF3_MANES
MRLKTKDRVERRVEEGKVRGEVVGEWATWPERGAVFGSNLRATIWAYPALNEGEQNAKGQISASTHPGLQQSAERRGGEGRVCRF